MNAWAWVAILAWITAIVIVIAEVKQSPSIDTPEIPVDHETCEGVDCDLVICLCDELVPPCEGAVAVGCGHNELLCEDCRPACRECMDDRAFDAGRW